MDAAVFALVISLFRNLTRFILSYWNDVFGDGSGGNVYVSDNPAGTPLGYTYQAVNSSNRWAAAPESIPMFQNLRIGPGCGITSTAPFLFVYVRDTLYLGSGSGFTLSGIGQPSTFANFLPEAGLGKPASQYTVACLKMFLSGLNPSNPLQLLVGGGRPGNATPALSGGGSIACGGGLVCITTKRGAFTPVATNVTANGGTVSPPPGIIDPGGMLFIYAKNIVTEDDNWYIKCDGGNGQGLASILGEIPRNTNLTGNPNPVGLPWGGGGVCYWKELDVI